MADFGNGIRPPQQFLNPGRRITPEELLSLIVILVRQMGGSVVLDDADIKLNVDRNETIQVLTKDNPTQIILKVVPNL